MNSSTPIPNVADELLPYHYRPSISPFSTYVIVHLCSDSSGRLDKPEVERYKCNVDACLFSMARNEAGIGSCIRDDQGRFVFAKLWISPIIDAHVSEPI
ncbi:hypothetical protein MTR_5g080690 [Medicago truncatula]|uniref:Uncharacterized protein n=1 Tax=Medicago truncatula TaxID=3880 RepID=G7KGV0_MEDTR|nr:hypothetical protein MTR_5g080690 [Medicago truncatula]